MPASIDSRQVTSGLVAGKITAVYGVKGWVKVHSYTSPPEGLFKYSHWDLQGVLDNVSTGRTLLPYELIDYRAHGKGFVAQLKGVDDRDQASLLCLKEIRVEMGELPLLPEGDYYWQQLIGLNVFTTQGKKPLLLGTITRLFETGANDVFEVAPCEGSIDKRSRLLPYVPGIHVTKVDLASGEMIVDWDSEF